MGFAPRVTLRRGASGENHRMGGFRPTCPIEARRVGTYPPQLGEAIPSLPFARGAEAPRGNSPDTALDAKATGGHRWVSPGASCFAAVFRVKHPMRWVSPGASRRSSTRREPIPPHLGEVLRDYAPASGLASSLIRRRGSQSAPPAPPRSPRVGRRRRGRGPRGRSRTMLSTASGSPSKTASTAPSLRFRDPAGDAEGLGAAARRVAEEDPLDPAVGDYPAPNHGPALSQYPVVVLVVLVVAGGLPGELALVELLDRDRGGLDGDHGERPRRRRWRSRGRSPGGSGRGRPARAPRCRPRRTSSRSRGRRRRPAPPPRGSGASRRLRAEPRASTPRGGASRVRPRPSGCGSGGGATRGRPPRTAA